MSYMTFFKRQLWRRRENEVVNKLAGTNEAIGVTTCKIACHSFDLLYTEEVDRVLCSKILAPVGQILVLCLFKVTKECLIEGGDFLPPKLNAEPNPQITLFRQGFGGNDRTVTLLSQCWHMRKAKG